MSIDDDFSNEVSEAIMAVPPKNIKGAGSTHENRCSPTEIKTIANATASAYGVANSHNSYCRKDPS